MRISLMPRVCSGLVCGFLIVLAGCSNPSSQTLASMTVTATPSALSIGGASLLKAVAHLSDGTTQDVTSTTQWTLSNPALATMSNNAVTAKAAGTLTVQAAYVEATPAGTSPSSATATPQMLNASTQITINAPGTGPGTPAAPAITWNTPAPISYGTALSGTQLNATANVAGAFTYTPAAGTVLKAGTQTLSVTFTPSDTQNYSAGTASAQLSVTQAGPVITWAAPAPVPAGTALGATQLNATASVPGTFAYNPASGTVLAAGSQALTAVFSPTDTTDYASATAHNSITVNATSGPISGPVGPTPNGCGGPTVNVNSGMSQSTLQSTIASAPKCAVVLFAAGTYKITSPLAIPCTSNLTLTGPVANPATAILAATYANSQIFGLNDCTGITIEYLHFENTTGIYSGVNDNANITIEHNQFTNLNGNEKGIFLDGSLAHSVSNGVLHNVITNTVVEYNSFGDAGSCTAEFASTVDLGGNCGGFQTHAGEVLGLTVEYNYFYHLEEPIHIIQDAGSYVPGATVGVCLNCVIDYNYFLNYHRIGVEVQIQVPGSGAGFEFSHNALVDPLNPFYGTFAVSLACCQNGFIQADGKSASPAQITNDNVLISTQGPGAPPFGFEWWGNGAQSSGNLVEGNFANGYVWGYGVPTRNISNAYVCGPNYTKYGGYVHSEGYPASVAAIPTMVNITTSPTCTTTASTAPVISQSSSGVTLTDSAQNTSIYYTVDGSTPTTSSTLYTGPFTPPAGATVSALAMWGVAPLPVSYPAGYGYVPSSVVTASFTGSSVRAPASRVSSLPSSTSGSTSTPTVVARSAASSGPATAALQAVTILPSAPVLTIGGSMQLKAVGTFNDGSTRDITADFAWTSSDMRTIAVTSSGVVSGSATGQAVLSGSYQGQQASVKASSGLGELEWSGPITITQGGTYSGNWQSADANTAAVTVATSAPVIIQDSHIRSSGNLIKVDIKGADLTVRNSVGLTLNGTLKGQPNGVFLDAGSPARLDVENNYMENVRYGVLVHGYSGSRSDKQTLVVRGNRARNLNGLLSDGMGGYLPGEGANSSSSRFVELDDVQSVPGIDLGWNEVVDYPTHSLVSDVIYVYRSSGTPNQPLEVHDSYIQGAYPYRPAQDAYRGGGIKTDGSADDTAANASAFTYIHDNQVVGTVSYGIAFSAGHDNIAANNRVISSGLLADGTKIAAQEVGLSNADVHGNTDRGSIYNNTMHDNLVGWTCWTCSRQGYRQDLSFPASPQDYLSNTVVSGKQITLEMEQREFLIWLNKTESAGIKVGPSF